MFSGLALFSGFRYDGLPEAVCPPSVGICRDPECIPAVPGPGKKWGAAMRAVVQRVSSASVKVENEITGAIGSGMMVLLGVSTEDTPADLKYITEKVLHLRIFDDENGVMNKSVLDTGGAILAVSQFTLYGDARGGRRPSYIRAAKPEKANEMYEQAIRFWREAGVQVETGRFRTEMQVSLVNDGPVTILLDSEKAF